MSCKCSPLFFFYPAEHDGSVLRFKKYFNLVCVFHGIINYSAHAHRKYTLVVYDPIRGGKLAIPSAFKKKKSEA